MKVDFITLYADNSFRLEKKKVVGSHINAGKGWKPKLIPGKCVFPERPPKTWDLKRRLKKALVGWKAKRLVIGVHGCEFCYSLNEDLGMLDEHWSTDEGEKFINKVIAWAAAKTKLFSKFEVYIFWILLVVVVVLQLLIIRRIGL